MAAVETAAVQATEAAMAAVHGRVVLVAGATGLVGREILAALLADKSVAAVHTLGRRPLAIQHAKLTNHVVDFAALPKLPKVDDCFIALGTTIKVAGSQEAFKALDLKAVEAVALAVKASGAIKLGVISAMGADSNSSVFYNRIKGEMEQSLVRLGFKSLVIARPSLIDGDRTALGQAGRAGEGLGLKLARCLSPVIPANYRAIKAGDIAHALIRHVKTGTPGVVTLMSGEMQGG
jgi:uncharacterized protein YbjT (DUF2867 family)